MHAQLICMYSNSHWMVASWLKAGHVPGATNYCIKCCKLWQPPCVFVLKPHTKCFVNRSTT
jgi:hypothetical protein